MSDPLPTLTLENLGRAITGGEGPTRWRLLDLRSEEAFRSRHLPRSVCIPADELEARSYELPPKRRLLALLAEDPRLARLHAARLRARGWEGARGLAEPISRWPGPWKQGPTRRFLWEPAVLVRRWAPWMPSGPILDLGCGAGRDAVFLARRGRAVTLIDRLPDALDRAQALAARQGVDVETRCADLRRTTPPDAAGGYAAILMIRCLIRQLFTWIPGALRPGGLLLLEGDRQDPRSHARPARPSRRLAPREALQAFASRLTIREYTELCDRAGNPLARLIAARPHPPQP